MVVLVVLSVASIGAFVATRRIVQDQEDRLLQQRSAEVGLLLSSSVSRAESSLGVLSAVALNPQGETSPAFTRGAGRLVVGGVARVVAAVASEGGPTVVASVGEGVAPGEQLPEERVELFDRAVTTDGMVATRLVDDEGAWLVYAVAQDGTVVFQESAIDPDQVLTIGEDSGSPFSGLRAALYAAPTTDADQVVLKTQAEVPLTGDVLRVPLSVGDEEWTLSVGATRPLVGGFANTMPWYLLGVGLLASGLATAVTVVLARRRSYAFGLVDSRTVDLRQAREAADGANRSKSEFLSRMSHELRTPLNAVLGFGQLLELDDLTENQKDAVAHIRKGGQHLLQLINEVLDISRVESGNMALSPEAVLVGEVLTESLDLIRPLAEQRGIQVVVDRSGGWDSYVFADTQRAKQVLLNLLSNAVKYNRQRGTVAVSVTSDGDRARILIADTGPGIRPEQFDLVFTPFERLGAEQSGVEGTGIGLALSKRLAEAMGGKLGLESVPGQGSTFWLELPTVEDPVGRYERLNGGSQQAVAERAATLKRTVLHIEDNFSNVTLVERILDQRPDVEVIAAMQGRLGVELAYEHHPFLVLLDLHLPDMGGEQVLERLRDDPRTASIPVVIVSADATPGQVQRLLASGASAYLTKPIEVRDLLRVVDEALVQT